VSFSLCTLDKAYSAAAGLCIMSHEPSWQPIYV
jgi:hypothetical protein